MGHSAASESLDVAFSWQTACSVGEEAQAGDVSCPALEALDAYSLFQSLVFLALSTFCPRYEAQVLEPEAYLCYCTVCTGTCDEDRPVLALTLCYGMAEFQCRF